MNESHSRNVGYRERNMSQNLIQCYRGRLFRYEDAPLVLLSNKKKKKTHLSLNNTQYLIYNSDKNATGPGRKFHALPNVHSEPS